MFPFLVIVYRRLASSEERSVRREFADVWDDYAAATPRFIPRPPATQPPAPPTRHRSGGQIDRPGVGAHPGARSEEHTSELQSLMRIAYAVFCLKQTKE